MTPEAILPELGDLIGQTYRLERLIGRGSMGTVFEAAHVWLDRRFAVKILTGQGLSTTDSVNRFHREARITSGLRHPNIIEVTDYNLTPEGIPYLVMELLDGESLRAYLKRSGKLGLASAGLLFDQIACGLAAAHAQTIIHRDLKPGNIFISQDEHGQRLAKILDFGLSKILHSRSQLTQAGTIMGSIPYISPEQLQSAAVDQRADLYSLAVVLFEMLAGQRPLTAESVGALVQKITHTPPPLRSVAPEMPASVEAVLLRALQKKPDQRYSGVTEFRDAFFTAAGLSSTQAGAAVPAPVRERSGSQHSSSPWGIGGLDTSAETVIERGSSVEVVAPQDPKSRGPLARHEMPTLIEGLHPGHTALEVSDSQPGSDPISYLPTQASEPALRPPSSAQPGTAGDERGGSSPDARAGGWGGTRLNHGPLLIRGPSSIRRRSARGPGIAPLPPLAFPGSNRPQEELLWGEHPPSPLGSLQREREVRRPAAPGWTWWPSSVSSRPSSSTERPRDRRRSPSPGSARCSTSSSSWAPAWSAWGSPSR